MLFTKPTKAVGIDVGTHSVKAVQMSRSHGGLRVDNVGYAIIDRAQYNTDPVVAQAAALREAMRSLPTAQSLVVGALPGQTVVIRYPRLPEMSDAQMSDAIEKEASQNIPYERSEVFLDWTPLESVHEAGKNLTKVLLVAARYEVIESRVQIASEAEMSYGVLGVDSLALADAAEGCDFLRVGESVALINLGASNTSIHFVKDGKSNFIRDVNWGAKELIQAVAKARRTELPEAERMLLEFAHHRAVVAAEPPPLPPDLPAASGAPAPAAPSSNLLDPFDDELGALDSLGPVAPPPKPVVSQPAQQTDKPMEEILAPPLVRLVSEIRRSFDYYEQQLYEHPVERLIVSGGVAHLGLLRDTLHDELGIAVELADPTHSALTLGPDHAVSRMVDHPAQFMVAVGLATRGMADL
ncbi:MAG: type IV pilus assembly protein PilM [Candidatus Hydrogenedentes bacterium]|nr:type IV pilus assembly protein PilM [Candidatus Hydrogenedentota bacterium]